MATAAEALEQHGLNGDRLLGIARHVAATKLRRHPYASQQLHEELVSFLVEQGLRAAIAYDPERSRPGYTFSSYLWDILGRRVPDYFRRKSEGFGDKRAGNNDRIVLYGDPFGDLGFTAYAVDEPGYELVEELDSLATR